MKKIVKKLQLNKEVIAELTEKDLNSFHGGEADSGSDRLCTNIPCYTASCPTRKCPTITTQEYGNM